MPSVTLLGGTGTVDLDDAVFGAPFNEALVHECVRADLNALRQGTASTKTRGKVRGGGAKPWRQKGTGRARAGSSRSPIWSGGGVVFGPSPRHYTFKINRKARRAALRSALSVHSGRDSLAALAGDAFDVPATKRAAELLDGWEHGRTVLLVLAADETAAAKSFRNIASVTVRSATDVSVADVISAASLVVSEGAVPELVTRATGVKGDAEPVSVTTDSEAAA